MKRTFNEYVKEYNALLMEGSVQVAYRGLIEYMQGLRTFFYNKYSSDYFVGSLYQGYMDMTYFSFTPKVLKKEALKIAIIFQHEELYFEIWLAGQNRQVQKKYLDIFQNSGFSTYHVPLDINEGFSIVDAILVDKPDFNKPDELTASIEKGTLGFVKEINEVLIC